MEPSELITQLQSSDIDARRQAARQAVNAANSLTGFAVPLVQAVADSDEEVSESIVATLEEMGAPEANTVAELAGMLSHQNADVGYWAATLLGRCGETAGAGVAALAGALSPPASQVVQQRSAWARQNRKRRGTCHTCLATSSPERRRSPSPFGLKVSRAD